jgi:uncharacterized protein YabN with tetrapyrrole methylase and pyrophosphatase domain
LTPGNPLFLNSIARFLVKEARDRGLSVQVHPGISEFDAVLCYLGLDVSAFGLQMFDARQLVVRKQDINPRVPLLILQTAGVIAGDVVPDGAGTAQDLSPLSGHLSRFYPPQHPVSIINISPVTGQPAHVTAPLHKLSELLPHMQLQSNLFIDRIRADKKEKASAGKAEGSSNG